VGAAQALAWAVFLLWPAAAPDPAATLDAFEEISSWRAAPAEGVKLSLSKAEGVHGDALRFDFDFQGRAGWAAARRELPIDLPENYELSFSIRGAGAANDLELKLIDSSGENVWWAVRREIAPPRDWTTLRFKKRHFSFAWGPARGGEIRRIGALEIVVTARAGGSGWIALDDLTLAALPAPGPPAHPPVLSASADEPGGEPGRAMDGDPSTGWRSARSGDVWLAADFGERREYGGLTVYWEPGRFARRYRVETSDDGQTWKTAREVEAGSGGRDDLYLPESESRFVRLRMLEPGGSGGYGIREIVVQPLSYGESPNAFFEAVAREAPRGTYPRAFSGEQSYWTVVGVDGDSENALLSEDGAAEPSRGSFSVEPFLFANGRLFSWSDVSAAHTLEGGDLPMPRVTWTGLPLPLEISAFAWGSPGSAQLELEYRISNPSGAHQRGRLFLAVRPFSVNPPQQFLNGPGGATPVHRLEWDREAVSVDGVARVFPRTRPSGFGAVPFETGPIAEFLAAGSLPPSQSAVDSFGYASGALAFDFDLASGETAEFGVRLPIHAGAAAPAGAGVPPEAVAGEWREKLGRVVFSGPPAAERLFRILRTNLADILVERDGPALRPGTRAYARSWIRDGSMIAAALLRLGHPDEVRAYLEWYAKYQEPTGRVPCCVDRRGADAVVENDSHGELIFAIAEYWRFTRDRALAERMFPHVEAAVSWIDRERQRRRTDEFRSAGRLAFFGLLPESISHEGYSAKAVHSYWDDFWALKGLKDAAFLAAALGRADSASRWAAIRDEFAADLHASVRRVIAASAIDFLPASADLADFDPTSTTGALDPGGEQARLPQAELLRTFERYFSEFVARRDGETWDLYTPYEIRNVGAFVRLGWRARAHEILDFFLADQRPAGWNGWAEVVGRELRKPRFVGDMPHAWVGSDFIRSVVDLFAWERERDGALVLGAGIPESWLEGGPGVAVRGLRTPHGRLDYSIRREARGVRFRIAKGLAIPRGGIALAPPLPSGRIVASLGGRRVRVNGGELLLRKLPADVLFEPGSPSAGRKQANR
jgi:F5/8 type C domain-containing protein